jgi:hypothetical protein
MTNREVISEIRRSNKLMEFDHIATDRFLLGIAKKYVLLLIQRETNKRRLWNNESAFHVINCLEMEQVPLAECIAYKSDQIISKSKLQLPQIENGYYGYLVQGVYDIEGLNEFYPTTTRQYINILKRRFPPKNLHWWIVDNYLYIDSPNIETVKLSAYFIDKDLDLAKYDVCLDRCDSCPDCREPLDEDFKCPGYLISQVIQMANQDLANSYQRYPEDLTDNNIHENKAPQ